MKKKIMKPAAMLFFIALLTINLKVSFSDGIHIFAEKAAADDGGRGIPIPQSASGTRETQATYGVTNGTWSVSLGGADAKNYTLSGVGISGAPDNGVMTSTTLEAYFACDNSSGPCRNRDEGWQGVQSRWDAYAANSTVHTFAPSTFNYTFPIPNTQPPGTSTTASGW